MLYSVMYSAHLWSTVCGKTDALDTNTQFNTRGRENCDRNGTFDQFYTVVPHERDEAEKYTSRFASVRGGGARDREPR